jgi:cyclase
MKKLIRIIPNLLIKDNYLVKGKQFENHKYVGDIFNAVKIFSEKKVHEIQILDISARKKNKCIDLNLIKKIRTEIFVPLAVGGGIKNIDEVSTIINEGVEKVIINSENFSNNKLLEQISKKFGSQSAVVSIDVKKIDQEYKIMSNNGEKMENYNLIDFIKDVQNKGAGEIILTFIENEGLKNGLNLELYKFVEDYVNVPLIANGGIGSINDITSFFDSTSFAAVACGALFVFFGNRNAVLINYPDKNLVEEIMLKYE